MTTENPVTIDDVMSVAFDLEVAARDFHGQPDRYLKQSLTDARTDLRTAIEAYVLVQCDVERERCAKFCDDEHIKLMNLSSEGRIDGGTAGFGMRVCGHIKNAILTKQRED